MVLLFRNVEMYSLALALILSSGKTLCTWKPVIRYDVTASALILPPRALNISGIDPVCLPNCQAAVSVQSKCGTPPDFKCLCTDENGHAFAQCMDCMASLTSGSILQSLAQLTLTDFTGKCAQNNLPIASLTLSVSVNPTATNPVLYNSAGVAVFSGNPVVKWTRIAGGYPLLAMAIFACLLASLGA
ncbi:hypothetical protein C8J57DRAFT_1311882 [Mycena rebaudengoi]|nr:hypothetical protein C8J57DRAFT_1311882 [Mycena rebaudengoi]